MWKGLILCVHLCNGSVKMLKYSRRKGTEQEAIGPSAPVDAQKKFENEFLKLLVLKRAAAAALSSVALVSNRWM